MSDFRFSPRPNHAHLIGWRSWGTPAFEEAREQDKPVLLSVSAAWCHWCHVMDETTYSDEAIIDTINRDFIPVRVDSDRRPDVNHRYNRGGWPTTVFLTPNGDIITGGTTVEPDRMRSLLRQVQAYYVEEKESLAGKAADLMARKTMSLQQAGAPVPQPDEAMEVTLALLREQFDPIHGGFGGAPKFPISSAHQLLLYRATVGDDAAARDMLTKTFDVMRTRDIYDPIEGGFFRYATARNWNQPHYEKMLETNVLLLADYLLAAHLLDKPAYRLTARGILRYLDTRLRDPESGAFFGSDDADETYYRLSLEERRQRAAPDVDRTVYAGWNGLAASAYVLASWVLDEPERLHQAGRVVDFLWDRMRTQDNLVRHYFAGEAHGPELLADQVRVGMALLDVYGATGRSEYLTRAMTLAEAVVEQFHDPEAGGFWDLREGCSGEGNLSMRDKPVDDNGRMAGLLQALSVATGESRFSDLALETLRAVAGLPRPHVPMAAAYALAMVRVQEDPVHIVITGNPDDPRTAALLKAGLRLRHPPRAVQVLDPEADAGLLDTLGYVAGPAPQAFVCYHMACSPPLTDPAAIPQAVQRLSQAGVLSAPEQLGATPGGGAGLAALRIPMVRLTSPPRSEDKSRSSPPS